MIMLADMSQHRWERSFEITWINSTFLESIKILLVKAEDEVSFERRRKSAKIVTWSIDVISF